LKIYPRELIAILLHRSPKIKKKKTNAEMKITWGRLQHQLLSLLPHWPHVAHNMVGPYQIKR